MRILYSLAQTWGWDDLECRDCQIVYDPTKPADCTEVELCPLCTDIHKGWRALEAQKFIRDQRRLHPETRPKVAKTTEAVLSEMQKKSAKSRAKQRLRQAQQSNPVAG